MNRNTNASRCMMSLPPARMVDSKCAAAAIAFMGKLGAACGLDSSTTLATVKGFPKIADFEKAYIENPANYYACIQFDDVNPNTQFTILYNETLAKVRQNSGNQRKPED